MTPAGRPKSRQGDYERITLEVRKDVLRFIDNQPAYRRELIESWGIRAMNEELRRKIKLTQIVRVDDEDVREQIVHLLEQTYWADNGGNTDGPGYLIELSELTAEQWSALGLSATDGTYLDEYNAEEHAEKLNSLQVAWTGWQAEGYALIAASPKRVEDVLSFNVDVNALIKAQGPGPSYAEIKRIEGSMSDPRDERNHMLLSDKQEEAYQQAIQHIKHGDIEAARAALEPVFTTVRVERP